VQTTITQAAAIAASNRADYWLQQVNRALPYGDCAAMITAAQSEGASVTQSDGKRFLVNNTAWVAAWGTVSPV
jgi:fructose-1,6-bisphosphatase/inositol monophosphatase family enzyme